MLVSRDIGLALRHIGERLVISPVECLKRRTEKPVGLTMLIPAPYLDRVIRLFLAVLCAFGLAFSPTATSAAIAVPAEMPGCTMDGRMPAKPADQSKMDCCSGVCQVTAAALLPERVVDAAQLKSNGALCRRAAAKELASFTASGLDPPPRLPS
jgi:hypothetical protein